MGDLVNIDSYRKKRDSGGPVELPGPIFIDIVEWSSNMVEDLFNQTMNPKLEDKSRVVDSLIFFKRLNNLAKNLVIPCVFDCKKSPDCPVCGGSGVRQVVLKGMVLTIKDEQTIESARIKAEVQANPVESVPEGVPTVETLWSGDGPNSDNPG